MNYAEMSDHQINVAVGDIAMNGTWHMTPLHPQNTTGGWLYGSNGIETKPLPDYCNSWADAGPIIEKFGISVHYIGDGHERGKWGADEPCGERYTYGDKPLRCAMIIFLWMQEKPNA